MQGLVAEHSDHKAIRIYANYLKAHRTASILRLKKGGVDVCSTARQCIAKQCPERSRTKGGKNAKLLAVTDASGRPLRLFKTAGQVSDYTGAYALLSNLPAADWMIADRGFDANWFREALKDRGCGPASQAGSLAKSLCDTTCAVTKDANLSRSCSAV